jgi:hypothetical protein
VCLVCLQDYFKMKKAFEKKSREDELKAKDERKEGTEKLPPLEVIEQKESDIATALTELSM